MLSREYLINQGECCGEGCLMCPYEPENQKGTKKIKFTISDISSGFYKKDNKEYLKND